MVMITNYRIFKIIAILLGAVIFVWLIYDFIKGHEKANNTYTEANNLFLKKEYDTALKLYKKVSLDEPENLYALEGQARSLTRLKNYNEAESIFKQILKKDKFFLPALTNIAILYDTIGRYEKAIFYYRKAILQDDIVNNRMSWINRFLKNIHFKPSNIEERLNYLEKQLSLKKNERILNNKKLDKQQQDYQM